MNDCSNQLVMNKKGNEMVMMFDCCIKVPPNDIKSNTD